MSEQKINVLLFGLGGIGGFYAFILSRNENVSLSVVGRSNYDAVKKNGFKIDSANHGEHVVRPDEVLSDPSQSSKQSFDYIVCTNKAMSTSTIVPLFAPVTSKDTTFVILQNGVGNEEPFRTHYPANTIISGVVWVGAKQPEPGHIQHFASEDTQMGLFPNSSVDAGLEKQRLDTFATLLRKGGTKFSVEENVQIARWEKVVWNCAWNGLTTLTGCDTKTWLTSSAEADEMTRALMLDVISVARACDVPLKDSLVDELFVKIKKLDGIYSSMYVDSRAGRPLEVDVILGFPMKKARELGLSVPTLKAVFAMVWAVDGRLRRDGEPLR